MNAADVFRILWREIPPSEEIETRKVIREILTEGNLNLYETYEELEAAARSELNMVNREDVRQIASDEYGMIDGPDG